MDITQHLIDFALGDVTPTDRASQILRLSAVDWAACGVAGAQDETFAGWASMQGGAGSCPTFARRSLAPADAALVNGTLSHALDFDDTHFAHIGHPSVVIFPAVLAAGPAHWRHFDEAALVGIEASIRIGQWLGRDHYQRGFHQTATAGAFGACVGVIRALGLNASQARAALGLCGSMASGLKAQFGTMGKPLNAGLAARAAIEAGLWAKGGMTGADSGIEAFGAAHDARADIAAFDGLGTDWTIETLSHKFHACCHGLHATLEALRGWDGTMPDRVEVSTHPRWMTVCNEQMPTTGLAAKFSYKQVVAMALMGVDTGDIGSFMDQMAQDTAMIALRDKITVVEDATLSETQARLRIKSGDQDVVLTHDLAAPTDLRDLSKRIRDKAERLAGSDKGGALWVAMRRGDLDAYRNAAFS